MIYRARPETVSALLFSGTEASAEEIREWASSLDLENVDVTYSERGELDVITEDGIVTLAPGWFVYCYNRTLYGLNESDFKQRYERIDG